MSPRKLDEEKVRHIRSSEAPGIELAKLYGVTKETIYNIRNGWTWGHVYDFDFA